MARAVLGRDNIVEQVCPGGGGHKEFIRLSTEVTVVASAVLRVPSENLVA